MSSPADSPPFGVLVVEDEPVVLALISHYLRTLGVAAFGAASARDAELLLRRHPGEIDAALIDLRLPGAGGVESRKRLDAVKPGLPCCLMSGAGVSGEAAPEGFLLTLDKPFTIDELKSRLESLRAAARCV
jgi:DNA-binding NtrC family response regulator